MKSKHVIVIGGGASGLVAAIMAAKEGARVTLVEQKDSVGKKILSTGNGKCNLTNKSMSIDCFRGDDISIVEKVLSQFGYEETINFFEELGVILKSRQGYIYPVSDQASTIADVLKMELDCVHVQVMLEEYVNEVSKTEKGFCVKTKSNTLYGDAVILSTGGKAAPTLGSNGSGYTLAKSFGHSLSPVVPALVQLKGKGRFFSSVAGVRTQAKVTLYVDGEVAGSDTGELQLTNYGISGIPVFQVSRYAAKALYARKSVVAELDFMPNMTDNAFADFVKERLQKHGNKNAEEFFVGMFHKKLIPLFLKAARIDNIESMDIEKLTCICKHFKVEIEGTNDFEQAQVCAGGVRTCEINPTTMESIHEKNLYLTGELLDVDGICGGYNLQWAWATGYIAGTAAAKGI